MDINSVKKGSAGSRGVSDVGAWGMNVVSSVGIIMANKHLMSSKSHGGYAFIFATTLTGFHFAVTAIVGMVSKATGFSASNNKHVPLWELLWFSLIANVSITAMNLSLMLNSVGFYQISKLSMIPVVCILEFILHGKHYNKQVKLAVLVVVLGVGVCTVTDVKVNIKGFLCALIAVLATSFQQISIGSLQEKYSIASFDLLAKTAPVQSLSLLVLGPFIDDYINGQFITSYKASTPAILFILLSCSLAVFCNMSQYLCIGRFSATSFQVLGHMKTVCILVLGWLLFDSELTYKNILGMMVAIAGMVIYSWAVEVEEKQSSKHAKNSMTDDELRVLMDKVAVEENTTTTHDSFNFSDIELANAKSTTNSTH